MEQMPSNTPMMESKPGPAGWLVVWMKVITKPGEQTFIEITDSPDATLRTAFIWVLISAVISGIVQTVVQVIYFALGISSRTPFPGMAQSSSSIGTVILFSICFTPILSILGFALGTAIFHGIAKLFRGTGTFEKLAYAMAAITLPFSLVTSVLSLFSAIPLIGTCFAILILVLLLYVIVLEIIAVKAVHRFGWGQAAGSVLLLPGILFLCSCLIIIPLTLMGPAIGNIFSSINQSLGAP